MSSTALRPLFFRDASQLLTVAGPPPPRRGKALQDLAIVAGGALLTYGQKILRVGSTSGLKAEAHRLKAETIDCRGRVVMPGFVDSHTHLIFAGSRLADFDQRLRGRTYEEIRAAGGGIQSSARRLREASENFLEAQAKGFLREFAAHGTTTVEVKTGYGLDAENEMKSLRVVARLKKQSSLELVPTLLAAHALPETYRGRRRKYIRQVLEELIPAVAGEKLAEFIDCFCDRGVFSRAECRKVLAAGRRYGLVPRLHAEQLTRTGSCRLAIELEAASADHLDRVLGSDIRSLARSNVVATLLPGSNFHLGSGRYAPARRMIDGGVAVALATDFNPGTSPTLNMQFILSLACSALRMTPAEAIAAATLNAAYSLRRADRLGSLEPGKQADVVVMGVQDYREIPYYFAWNHCVMSVRRGRIIYSRPA